MDGVLRDHSRCDGVKIRNGPRMIMTPRTQFPCPVCLSPDTRISFHFVRDSAPGSVLSCDNCKSLSTVNREDYRTTYADLTSDRLDAAHTWLQGAHKSKAFAQWLKLVKFFFLERLSQSVLLDVGCGTGGFLRFAAPFVGSGWGFDHSSAQVSYAREFPNLQSRVFRALSVHEFREQSTIGKVDLITLWDVLEHLHDPELLLRQLREVAATGALVFVAVPNALFARLKIMIWQKLSVDWTARLVPWEHVFYYSPMGLDSLLSRAGWEILASGPVRNYDRALSVSEWVRRRYSDITFSISWLKFLAPQIFVLARAK